MPFEHPPHRVNLVLGQQLRLDFGDADLLRDRLGDRAVVPGEHHEVLDAHRPQRREHFAHAGPRAIREADHAEKAFVLRDRDHRLRRLLDRRRGRGDLGRRSQPSFSAIEEPQASRPHHPPIDATLEAAALDDLDVGRRGEREPPRRRLFDHRASERVRRVRLDRGGHRKKRRLVESLGRMQRDDLRLAFGQGAGLVERDRADRAEILEVHAALDEHAMPRRLTDARKHRRRRRDRERTRRRADKHGHRAEERIVPREPAGERRDEDHAADEDEDERHEDPGEALGQSLARGTLLLRLLDEADHAAHEGLGGELAHLDDEPPVAVHGAREDLAPPLLDDRPALAGDRALIDLRGPFLDEPVDGKAFAGPHHHAIAADEFADRHDLVATIAAAAGRRWRELSKRLDRLAGLAERIALETVTERKEKEQQPALLRMPDRRGAERRDDHEQIDVELQPQRHADGVPQDVGAGDEVAPPVERPHHERAAFVDERLEQVSREQQHARGDRHLHVAVAGEASEQAEEAAESRRGRRRVLVRPASRRVRMTVTQRDDLAIAALRAHRRIDEIEGESGTRRAMGGRTISSAAAASGECSRSLLRARRPRSARGARPRAVQLTVCQLTRRSVDRGPPARRATNDSNCDGRARRPRSARRARPRAVHQTGETMRGPPLAHPTTRRSVDRGPPARRATNDSNCDGRARRPRSARRARPRAVHQTGETMRGPPRANARGPLHRRTSRCSEVTPSRAPSSGCGSRSRDRRR